MLMAIYKTWDLSMALLVEKKLLILLWILAQACVLVPVEMELLIREKPVTTATHEYARIAKYLMEAFAQLIPLVSLSALLLVEMEFSHLG